MNIFTKNRYFVLAVTLWTILLAVIIGFSQWKLKKISDSIVNNFANIFYQKDLALKNFISDTKGVYVVVDSVYKPNEYIIGFDKRDLKTITGEELTILNPIYFQNLLNKFYDKNLKATSKTTSLNPINETNYPDEWEKHVLMDFKADSIHEGLVVKDKGDIYYRYMSPLIADESCVNCHNQVYNQSYEVGDVVGGYSTTIPITDLKNEEVGLIKHYSFIMIFIWWVGIISLFVIVKIIRGKTNALKKAAFELTESRSKFKRISDLTMESVLLHINWIALDTNKAFAKLTGYNLADLEGENVLQLIFPEKYLSFIRQCLNKDVVLNSEVEIKNKNGFIVPVEIESKKTHYLNKQITVTTFRDITVRKQAELALQKAENKLNSFIKETPLGFVELNKELHVTKWNKSAERIFGYEKAEMLGCNISLLFSKDQSNDYFKNVILKSINKYQNTYLNFSKNGKRMVCRWYITVKTVENNSVSSIFSMIEDITERWQAKEELILKNVELKKTRQEAVCYLHAVEEKNKKLNKQAVILKKAINKAEENNMLKSAFLANISHEIRTPLNGLLGFSQLITINDIPNEKKTEYTELMQTCGSQLLSIVNDVLDISKLETMQLVLRKEPVDVYILLRSLYEQFLKEASQNGSVLRFPLVNKNITILGDEWRLSQVISNLLRNAIKYTKNGAIEFGCKANDKFMMFYVKDNGLGIPENFHKRIFNRFEQVRSNTANLNEGLGLGLSICKGLVELMGGKIWVESESGEGAEFRFLIPLLLTERVTVIEGIVESGEYRNKTILIVESCVKSLVRIKKMLEETSLKVINSFSHSDAINTITMNKNIDLVLIDAEIPCCDDRHAASKIKEIRPDIPIIAQATISKNDLVIENQDARYDNYLAKPIDKAELLNTIERTLQLAESIGN